MNGFNEKILSDYICKNIREIFPNLRVVAREYKVFGRRVDLILRDINKKNVYIALELKKDVMTEDSVFQALNYAKELNKRKSKNGKRKFIPMVISRGKCFDSKYMAVLLKLYKNEIDLNECCYYNLFRFNDKLNKFEFNYDINSIFKAEDKYLAINSLEKKTGIMSKKDVLKELDVCCEFFGKFIIPLGILIEVKSTKDKRIYYTSESVETYKEFLNNN